MEERITRYIKSLVIAPMIHFKVYGNKADQIFSVAFFEKNEDMNVPLAEILVSSWDSEETWKKNIKDTYAYCVSVITGNDQKNKEE